MTKIFWASPWIPFKGKRRERKGKRERRAASPVKILQQQHWMLSWSRKDQCPLCNDSNSYMSEIMCNSD
jgi:hypothetical protein